jgi:hypothetical protein
VSGTVEAVAGAVLSSQRKAGCAGGDGVAGVALFVLRMTGLVSFGLVSVAAGLVQGRGGRQTLDSQTLLLPHVCVCSMLLTFPTASPSGLAVRRC